MSFLKNLFGGPSKNSGNSIETMKRRQQAAIEVLGIFQEHFQTTFESHPASVLYTGAWLAGTSLYRSFGYTHNPSPGTVILSDKANEEWPKLMNLYLYAITEKSHIKLDPKELILEIPAEYKSKKDILTIQELFQDSYNQIMRKHGFDYVGGAQVGAFICAIITETHCVRQKDLDPKLAAGIVSMGLVEGAKIAPPPLGSTSALAQQKQNDIKQYKNRVVLGERDAVIKETHENGGISIDINPGALTILKQGKIDPYLIYEKALLNQIEAKIPRIDFVNSDVDKLYDEWNQKSHDLAPIHVRLLIWLKNNSAAHKYVQDGNSWILKE